MTSQSALIAMPTAEELADTLTVHRMGGDLEALARACRIHAAHCPEPGRSRCLRAADLLELADRILTALELVEHAAEGA